MNLDLAHVTADEQAAIIAATLAGTHPTDHARFAPREPLWVALDEIRAAGGEWVAWDDLRLAVAGRLAAWPVRFGPEHPLDVATRAVSLTGVIRHAPLVPVREVRNGSRGGWWTRSVRFEPVWHPPLTATRWERRAAAAIGEQLTLGVAA